MTGVGGDPARLAQSVASTVSRVPGVTRLTGGRRVEAATYHAGGKVVGVVVREHVVSVHLVVSALPLPPVVERVRGAAAEVLAGLGASQAVEVVVEDLDLDAFQGAGCGGPRAAAAGKTPA